MSKPWTEQAFAVVDVETTSFDIARARICEVAAVIIENGAVLPYTFETLVNPRVPIEKEVVEIHGITDAAVANAPEFCQVRRGLEEYLINRTLMAHNTDYDVGQLRKEMRTFDFGVALDTVRLAVYCRNSSYIRRLSTLVRRYSLEADILSTYQGVGGSARPHRAGYDAHAAAHLFVKLLRHHFVEPPTMTDLERICGVRYS